MKKIGESLDTRSLALFIAVMDSDTLTEAAEKLAMKQSTVSHALDKLRGIFDDPLLIRSGRSVVPTNRAVELLPQVRTALATLEALTDTPTFDPQTTTFDYCIAANDFQTDWLIPELYRRIRPLVDGLRLRLIPSWLPDNHTIRNDEIDIIISPSVPQSGDVMQRKLFDFQEVFFYDAKQRPAPKTAEDFTQADYICPMFFLDYEPVNLDISKQKQVLISDRTQIITHSFTETALYLQGTEALGVAPKQLKDTIFQGFAHVPFPAIQPSTMYLIWNKRHQKDPKHQWFREQLVIVAKALAKSK